MVDAGAQDIEADGEEGFYKRLAVQPHASMFGHYTGRRRNEIIDVFLTELSDGLAPHTAATRAGVLLDALEFWASEDSEVGKIFAMQWRHAEAYALEQREAAMRKLAFEGYEEYVTGRDGVVNARNPITQNWEPLKQRRYHADLIKFFLAADNPAKFGKRSAMLDLKANDISQNDMSRDAPQIAPDEPGPSDPIP